MIKIALEQMNASSFAEVALLMFTGIFLAVVIRTLRMGREVTKAQANIVMGDQGELQA